MNTMRMDYEHVLRRAFQCGRYGVAGANADTYDGLDMLSKKQDNKYYIKLGQISAFLQTSIHQVKKEFANNLDSSIYDELENIDCELSSPSLEIINKNITRLNEIYLTIGLFPK